MPYHIRFNCFLCVFVCYHLASFFWCWVTLLLTLDNFLYFTSFLYQPFIRRCLVQSSLDTYFKVRFMLFSCAVTDFEGGNAILLFNHYFNDSNF